MLQCGIDEIDVIDAPIKDFDSEQPMKADPSRYGVSPSDKCIALQVAGRAVSIDLFPE